MASPARPAPAAAQAKPAVDIPFEQFTLPNGLRVIVHTDRKAPIVAVNIWYHVGSKDEPKGRSGFAHLFEHLMFQGSENHKGEYFEPFELVGATEQNGTTNSDRTNYFQNVPTTALDTALWMESDRMGHLLGAIDQAVLDEQRGVVQNEKRQSENQPYGQVFETILRDSYPDGHPYRHTTIGSMSDLNAASLEDVKNWFRSWYGPNNAVLVLAGDIDVATAKEKVARYFGDIPPSAAVRKLKPQVAARTRSSRGALTDNVPQTRVYRLWNVPPASTVENDRLRLLAQVLGGSRSSRLDRRLVFTDKLVDKVSASLFSSELGGIMILQADVKQGVDVAKVEAALTEEVSLLLQKGITKDELERARTVLKAGFVRGVERIGGFGGKADVLARCAVFTGKADCFRASLTTLAKATTASVTAAGRAWLRRGDYTLVVSPGERPATVEEPAVKDLPPTVAAKPARNLKAIKSDVDRTAGVPMPSTFPELRAPKLERGALSNGLKVVVAERRGLPLVQLQLLFRNAGFASDQGRPSGSAAFTMAMLEEGAGDYDALAFGDRMEELGATLSTDAGLDASSIRLSSLTEQLEPSLALLADVATRPRLADADIERIRAEWLAAIKQEKARPGSLIARLTPPLLYGAGHPYAIPPSGTGTEAGISALRREHLQAWLKDWVRPDNGTLIVVGDTTLAELKPKLEAALGAWKAPATPVPSLKLPAARLPAKARVFLVDQPGAIQANLSVSQLAPSSSDPRAIELELANAVLGGEFSSRLNMNLREDKHWAYGAYSRLRDAQGQRIWSASAPVQIDKTVESIKELAREVGEYATSKAPAKPEELKKIQSTEVLALPGSFETAAAVLRSLVDIELFRRPDAYEAERAARIRKVTLRDVTSAAATLKPAALTWVIVGDLKKIEAGIRALKLGDVKVLDADGKILR
ncbi:MAG: pitrilysin family protein [Kofleriaceae bacterium]